MEPHRVLQETAYPSLAYGLFGLGRFLQQIPDSYKRVIFMSICGSIRLSLDSTARQQTCLALFLEPMLQKMPGTRGSPLRDCFEEDL